MAPTAMFLLAISFLFISIESAENNLNCEEREKNLAALDLAKDAITKARDLYPHCEDENATESTSGCGRRERSLGYLEVALNLITETAENYPTCPFGRPEDRPEKPADCSRVLESGRNGSGVYSIWPKNHGPLDVFCDMDTDGGGWTVIQRRGNFSQQEDFYRTWNDYKKGFGELTRDFWIGNDNIFALTNQAPYTIRFDMQDVGGRVNFAEYRNFKISDEKMGYRLSVSNYSGSAGDCLTYLDGMRFSTRDRRNDRNGGDASCSDSRRAGWWFNTCSLVELVDCNPNGRYSPGQKDAFRGNYWWYWTNSGEGMLSSEIKLKRTAFKMDVS